jgi:hypothetical protein
VRGAQGLHPAKREALEGEALPDGQGRRPVGQALDRLRLGRQEGDIQVSPRAAVLPRRSREGSAACLSNGPHAKRGASAAAGPAARHKGRVARPPAGRPSTHLLRRRAVVGVVLPGLDVQPDVGEGAPLAGPDLRVAISSVPSVLALGHAVHTRVAHAAAALHSQRAERDQRGPPCTVRLHGCWHWCPRTSWTSAQTCAMAATVEASSAASSSASCRASATSRSSDAQRRAAASTWSDGAERTAGGNEPNTVRMPPHAGQ